MKMNHVVAAFSTLAALMATPVSHAAPVTIDAGWDLVRTTTAFFKTGAGTIRFEGVPFGNVNISSLNGVLLPAPSGAKSYGSTDTIISRSGGKLADAGVLRVDLQMTALNLVSKNAFDPDGPPDGLGGGHCQTQFTMPQIGGRQLLKKYLETH